MNLTRALIIPTALLVSASFTASCTHVRAPLALEEGAPQIRDTSYAAEKREMIYQIDRRMNGLVSSYTAQIEAIRLELINGLERVAPPARLVAVDRALRGYGAAEEERYGAAIDRLVHHSIILELNVSSYRLEQSKKNRRTTSNNVKGEEKRD